MCLFRHMAANWTTALLSCALWFWQPWFVTLKRIESFHAAVTFSQANNWCICWCWTYFKWGRVCGTSRSVDLRDPALTAHCLHSLAFPDQENFASPANQASILKFLKTNPNFDYILISCQYLHYCLHWWLWICTTPRSSNQSGPLLSFSWAWQTNDVYEWPMLNGIIKGFLKLFLTFEN